MGDNIFLGDYILWQKKKERGENQAVCPSCQVFMTEWTNHSYRSERYQLTNLFGSQNQSKWFINKPD